MVEKTETNPDGFDRIIDMMADLGRNIVWKDSLILREKQLGRNITINTKEYHDAYLDLLNHNYPLDTVIGSRKDEIDYFVNNSLENIEGEKILEMILSNSVDTDSWQSIIFAVDTLIDTAIKTADEYVKHIGTMNPDYKVAEDLTYGGIRVAKMRGFVELFSFDNKVAVIPTPSFAEYCISKNK